LLIPYQPMIILFVLTELGTQLELKTRLNVINVKSEKLHWKTKTEGPLRKPNDNFKNHKNKRVTHY
jgi:hypothetical protein